MSDFVPRDLPDLWEEILRRHWMFLETEESIQKLEERKQLEGCLKEFLCVVQHDRKFFLPETGQVLRRSVRELPDFSAQNAIVAFETISQYANNLFTKPWRKEYRTLKTYSGCFQHDIQSRLIDAEQLFVAMGYRRVSEDTFVLEGPICPDQVTNVSRDAMAAYVECQIMKHIYAGVTAAGYSCSWKDVLQFRERIVGSPSRTIKEMVGHLSEKRMRKEQPPVQENTYSNVATVAPTSCVMHGHSMAHHPSSSASCALHPNGLSEVGKYMPPYPAPPPQQPHLPGPLMTHSRSLEHYQEPHAHLPHRHSFDQQLQQQCQLPHVYEAPYDCLDGLSLGSSASYAAVAGAYNAPGNRYPLPYNISSQLNAPYASPAELYGSGEPVNMYATLGKTGPAHSCDFHRRQTGSSTAAAAALAAMQHRQSTYPPDHHLIDFDERAQLTQHDFGTHDYDPQYAELRTQVQPSMRGNPAGMYATYGGYDLPTTLPQAPPPTAQDMYIYARPVPKSSRMRALAEAGGINSTDKHPRSAEKPNPMDNNRKMHKELKERASRTAPAKRSGNERDIPATISDLNSYDSASLDGFVTLDSSSPPLMPKVQEGVGSFESWNYVFKNLERSGYTKDLGDREDLLVQSLDLDSLAITNGGAAPPAEKRREPAKPTNGEKARTLEKKTTGPSRREVKVVQAAAPSPLPNSSSAGVKKVKSALKTAVVDNRGSASRHRTGTVPKQPPAVSPQLIVTSPNEWSCSFCTFLNPDTKRICEMCCRSKDFNLEAATAASSSAAAAAAAATSVSHASSTCV
ncbi:protein tamozhennic [Drosophila ficusphila]|uniref:protein tamozhennic n=1 Tax=Drosophila ficusphila TaxID=30025 RepID=UPI0007E637CE|nr:protein tamozhennic [Drosophila ficusphila]XP_017045184.1 protein tamozhennic [Drosophila ficusphila]XP_017045185.1 protein tamozhennic [Drosophila ficusphila]